MPEEKSTEASLVLVDKPKPWDQLENEPHSAYAEFLIYRDLGKGRSIDRAYQGFLDGQYEAKGPAAKGVARASRAWNEHSSLYDWPERAAKWDVHILQESGKRRAERKIERLASIEEDTIELIDMVVKDNLALYKDGPKGVANLQDKLVAHQLLHGAGGSGQFILKAHKALYGEKREISGELKLTPGKWKI